MVFCGIALAVYWYLVESACTRRRTAAPCARVSGRALPHSENRGDARPCDLFVVRFTTQDINAGAATRHTRNAERHCCLTAAKGVKCLSKSILIFFGLASCPTHCAPRRTAAALEQQFRQRFVVSHCLTMKHPRFCVLDVFSRVPEQMVGLLVNLGSALDWVGLG